jgi:hypothetical protein
MPTRPSMPDPTGATQADQGSNPFAPLGAGLGAGLGFFQDWIKAAGSAMPNMPGAASAGASGISAWTMPTLDPAELEKRIQDLKTVQFWLEQNARMIAMTIQGLEVQRMTLTTLKGMNVSMDALRESLKARADSGSAATPPAPQAASRGSDEQPAQGAATEGATGNPDLINPMRWWDTLTQQFTHLASQAAQTVGDSVSESMDALKQAQASAPDFTAPASQDKPDTAAGTSPAPSKRAARKTAASKSTRKSTGKP